MRITDSSKTNSDNVVPGWSHDGRSVYFSSNRTGAWQIWRHALDTGAEDMVTTSGGFNGMETADGKSLVYVADLGNAEIRQLSLQGQSKNLPLVTLGLGMWHAWTVTQDGLFFVAHSSASSMSALSRLDLKSGKIRSFAQVDQVVNDSLLASPDGRWILFARRPNTNTSIMILDGVD